MPIPPEVEDGWFRCEEGIHFMARNGPIWYRRREGLLDVGFLSIAEVHGNNQDAIHGGMIASFADFALGHCVWFGNYLNPNVTVHLDVNFVSAGPLGEWIHCTPEVVRKTRSTVFMRGDIMAAGRIVATASGVWRTFQPR